MKTEIKILVADDIDIMRGLLKRELLQFGYENVIESHNGEDALHKFKLSKFHLAMIDINMPLKNGVELLKDIRAIDPDIFAVLVSAESSAENIKAAIALGINGFIVKPYTTAKISGIIQNFNKHLQGLGIIPP